ncbi:MAG: RNA polymerase subunit sigma-70, partial [Acidobacteria bacterium]|nr:RNA polymerase subunit sigma-70 [Acidobacteriota bacterium]
ALVHEVYLRLAELRSIHWQGRVHFFGSVSQMIRRVLVDHARRTLAEKRGSGLRHRPLEEALAAWTEEPEDLLDLHESLDELEREDPELALIVQHRFFGGLSHEEIADLTGKSHATIKRRWRVARAWLYRRLSKACTR